MTEYQRKFAVMCERKFNDLGECMDAANNGKNAQVRKANEKAAIQLFDELVALRQVDKLDKNFESFYKKLMNQKTSRVYLASKEGRLRTLENMFFNFPFGYRVQAHQAKHIIKRVEGNYQGDVECMERNIEAKMVRLTSQRAFETFRNSVGLPAVEGDSYWEYTSGETVVWSVEVEAAVGGMKTIGYVTATTRCENNTVEVSCYIDSQRAGSLYLSSNTLAEDVMTVLTDLVKERSTDWNTEKKCIQVEM